MTQERRYQDDEVREIFGLAAQQGPGEAPAAPTEANGLTLANIQEIGREVGLEPEAIARAAASLDSPTAVVAAPRTSLGVPIEVGRTVPLARPLTDEEWERLVAELRETFRARGRFASHGAMREWVNGNLHAYVEPAESGYRLRLRTIKGNAMQLNMLGIMGVAAGALSMASIGLSAGLHAALGPAILAVGGVAALVSNRVRLPSWARERQTQMDAIAAKVGSMVTSRPAIEGPQE